jgi:hypothetical protein
MNYPIWIGIDKRDHSPLVGAAACDAHGEKCEQVYPSQLRHRCVAYDRTIDAHIVCTPTYARTWGLRIVECFQAADHAYARR